MRSVRERNNLRFCVVGREEELDGSFEDRNDARTGLSRQLPEFSRCLPVDNSIDVHPIVSEAWQV